MRTFYSIRKNVPGICVCGTEHLFSVYKSTETDGDVWYCIAENMSELDALLFATAKELGFPVITAAKQVQAIGDANFKDFIAGLSNA